MKKKRSHILLKSMILTLVGLCCAFLFDARSQADWDGSSDPYEGYESKTMSIGTLKIMKNEDWSQLQDGCVYTVDKLFIGQDVTTFGFDTVTDGVPNEVAHQIDDIIDEGRFGDSNHIYNFLWSLLPEKIVVSEGNPIFRVRDGLLINEATNEVVLSEMSVKDVVIPEGVQSISWKAFYDRPLHSVQFPESMQKIGPFAFAKCKSLVRVILPDSITQIGICAFSDCVWLQQIKLPEGLQQIEAFTFSNCKEQFVEIPESVQAIGPCAFIGGKELRQVILHPGLSKIDVYAFSDCPELYIINFPEGIVSIGEGVFSGCLSLRRVIFPDSLQEIGEYMFYKCNLSVLRFPPKLNFLKYVYGEGYISNHRTKRYMSFLYDSVDTVICSGSDYDFGYRAIDFAKAVYFLGEAPKNVGQILNQDSVEKIYCSDEFEFEWTRSTVASWVRQRLTILPADQMNDFVETTINNTPTPTNTPKPPYEGMNIVNTPRPTATPQPSASPASTTASEKQTPDPVIILLIVFIVLVIATVVLLILKPWAKKKRPSKKRRTAPQLPEGTPTPNEMSETQNADKLE